MTFIQMEEGNLMPEYFPQSLTQSILSLNDAIMLPEQTTMLKQLHTVLHENVFLISVTRNLLE